MTESVEPRPRPRAATPRPPKRGHAGHKRWQKIVSVVLLVLGFILVPLSAVAIWSHNQLTNTDRYVETVSPLAENKDIQQAVAAGSSTRSSTRRTREAHRERAAEAGQVPRAPVATAMKSYATDVTEKLLASEQFQTLWDAANRRAHNQLVALLTDDPSKAKGAVAIKDGKVTLDLGSVIKQVQAKLVDAGLTFLENVNVPPVSRTITIINTEGLAEARSYLSILDTLAWVLPVLGVLASSGRRSSCRHAAAGDDPRRARARRRVRVHARAARDRPLALPCDATGEQGRRVSGVRHPRAQPALRRHHARRGRHHRRDGGVLRRAVGAGEVAGRLRRQGDLRRPAQGR